MPKKKSEKPTDVPAAMRLLMEGLLRDLGRDRANKKKSDKDLAQDLVYEAMEARTAAELFRLVTAALELDPSDVDARLMRADFRGLEGEARIFELKDIIAGGAKSLGKKAFKEVVPRFWGFVETLPYMRARQQLADLNIPQTSVQVGSFSQADNRCFLQHCLQEILKRRLRVEVAAVERLTPELVPAVALEL